MNENWTKFIELFLQGELSPEDTAKLQAELDRNPEMRQSLEQQKLIHQAAKRSGERQMVKGIRQNYRIQKTVKTSILSVIVAAAIATVAYFAIQAIKQDSNTEFGGSEAVAGKYEQLDSQAELANLPIAYFEHNGKDATFLSPQGILISVPEKTFLLNGKPYQGKAVIQFQEALEASDIIKAGLSTTSGDRLLETQGMFQLKAFTPDGKRLTINEKNGIYLQVPVDENKEGMMLFNGVKTANGEIDWQNPKPIEKMPIQANMLDLDLYPPGYEAKLDELKWSQKKKKRDSLYLSFEEVSQEKDTTLSSNQIDIRCATSTQKVELKTNTFLLHNTENFQVYLKDKKMSIDRNVNSDDETNLNYTTRNFYGISPVVNIKKLSESKFQLIIGYLQDSDFSDDPRKINNDIAAINKKAEVITEDHFGFTTNTNQAKIQHLKTMKRVNDRVPFYESTYLLEVPENYIRSIEIDAKKVSPNIFAGPNKYFNIEFKKNKNSSVAIAGDAIVYNPLPPSKVLAIWKKDFNKTILATKDFEKRMKAIHGTCNEKVFDVYANQLNKAMWELDEQVVKMGYSNFQAFADERVGALKLDNAHMNTLRMFYQSNVSRLKDLAKKDKDFQKALEMSFDSKVRSERKAEVKRSIDRTAQVFEDEYNLNLKNVMKQLGKTVGLSIHGGGTVYNIDKYVRDATIARKSTIITDPDTGKTAQITYNPFQAIVKNAKDYNQLYLYLLPKELTSFQRINATNGKFDYPLNDDIKYDAVFVGISDKGYYIAEHKNLVGNSSAEEVDLKSVSEKEFERTLEKLSKDRQKASTKSNDVANELNWLKLEKANYQEQKLRQKNAEFRRMMRRIVHPCGVETEAESISSTSRPKVEIENNFK